MSCSLAEQIAQVVLSLLNSEDGGLRENERKATD